ncbi:MAG: DUF4215 domain-containing protein [Myxococcota bacterium]
MKNTLLIVFLIVVTACGDETSRDDGDGGPEPCATGIICPVGTTCAANQLACITGNCGNGHIDAGEVCDDGNIIDGDGCGATCQVSVGAVCGDGNEDASEACDDGNALTETSCAYGTATCLVCDAGCNEISIAGHVCGDGHLDAGHEVCDDGNTASETACPYGSAICAACNADCSGTIELSGNYCGDGAPDAEHEQCDDANTITEAACPYGSASCTICAADCIEVPATGNVCGDGVVDPENEACDDHNTNLCGSCGFSCLNFTLGVARGQIVTIPGVMLVDGETIIVGDGFESVTFELDSNASTTVGTVAVTFLTSNNAATIAAAIRNAVNNHPTLAIDATQSGALVNLTNQRPTALGNVAITETVDIFDFVVTGMSGGQGGDCSVGQGCSNGFDCASGVCALDGLCEAN